MDLPSGFHDAAEFGILANRIEIRILVYQVEAPPPPMRFFFKIR